MSESSPADLAVAFRSFARRQREAVGDADAGSVADLSSQLDQHVAAAASVLGVAPDAEVVATAIEGRRLEDWDDATLVALRQQATDAGRVVRTIGERVDAQSTDGEHDDGDQ